LCTWWDVLDACRGGGYFEQSAMTEVRRFLDDPVSWSRAHGGIGGIESGA
jgi:orotate phosphoribosyltransferase